MFPCSSLNNPSNSPSGNAEHDSNLFLGIAMRMKFSDLNNLTVGKFGDRTIHTPIIPICSVSGSVKHILAMGIPLQIFKKAVGGDSITMPTFHSRRARTDEGEKNKTMNKDGHLFRLTSQIYAWVTTWAQLGFKNPLWDGRYDHTSRGATARCFPVRSYPPLVRHFITGKVRNLFPSLGGIAKMLISHGVALLDRVASGLEPFRCPNTVAACFIYSNLM
jgi:hypothetical protein